MTVTQKNLILFLKEKLMNTGHEKRKNSFSFHNNPVQQIK